MGTLFPYHICIVQHQRTAQLALHRAAVSPCTWGRHAKPPGHDAHLAAGTNEQSYPCYLPGFLSTVCSSLRGFFQLSTVQQLWSSVF